MTNVNFKVLNIEKAMKKDCVVVTLTFEGSDKQFTYVRRAYGNTTVIDGCRIYFDANYQVEKVEREYETKGVKKMSTAKQVGTTSSKIKNELEGKGIEIPKIQIPQVEESGEVHHDRYEEIKCCLECGIPVYLAGPAGSGKNHTVEQIANELGWNFYFSNSVQQEYKLTGFIDAGGNSTRQSSIKLVLMRTNASSSWTKWMLPFLKFWFFSTLQLLMATLSSLTVELILTMFTS